MGAAGFFSYDEFIQEQDVPEHKTTIKRSYTRIVKQRQESCLTNPYEKARQDVGLFYIILFSHDYFAACSTAGCELTGC